MLLIKPTDKRAPALSPLDGMKPIKARLQCLSLLIKEVRRFLAEYMGFDQSLCLHNYVVTRPTVGAWILEVISIQHISELIN